MSAQRSGQILLRNTNIVDVPDEIWKINELKILDLSDNKIETLSPQISNLSSLYYLNLDNNDSLIDLPLELASLHELRYICLMNCSSLDKEILQAYEISPSAPVRFGLSARSFLPIKQILSHRAMLIKEKRSQKSHISHPPIISHPPTITRSNNTSTFQGSDPRLDASYLEYLQLKKKYGHLDDISLDPSHQMERHMSRNQPDQFQPSHPHSHSHSPVIASVPQFQHPPEIRSPERMVSDYFPPNREIAQSSFSKTHNRLFPKPEWEESQQEDYSSSQGTRLRPEKKMLSPKVGAAQTRHDVSHYINARKNIISRNGSSYVQNQGLYQENSHFDGSLSRNGSEQSQQSFQQGYSVSNASLPPHDESLSQHKSFHSQDQTDFLQFRAGLPSSSDRKALEAELRTLDNKSKYYSRRNESHIAFEYQNPTDEVEENEHFVHQPLNQHSQHPIEQNIYTFNPSHYQKTDPVKKTSSAIYESNVPLGASSGYNGIPRTHEGQYYHSINQKNYRDHAVYNSDNNQYH